MNENSSDKLYHKLSLENKIREMLTDFTNETGLTVEAVEVNLVTLKGWDSEYTKGYIVHLECSW